VTAPGTAGAAPRWRRLGLEAALLAPAAVAGAGLGRLTDAPGAARVLVPVLLCVGVGHLAASVVRRAGPVVSLLCGAFVVAVLCAWWFEPGTTAWGVPTAATLRGAGHLLSSAVTITVHSPTPLDAVPAVVVCLAAGAGAAAVAARSLAPPDLERAGRLRGWLALVPSAGLFCYTALLNSGADRVLGAALYLGAALLYVIAFDRRVLPTAGPGVSLRRAPGRTLASWGVGAAGLGVAAVTVATVAAAVSPVVDGMRVHAFAAAAVVVGGGPDGGPSPPGAADAVSLFDDLSAVVGNQGRTVLFTARSPVPTYWQVATLSTFDGSSWDPDSATLMTLDGITPPPVSSLPHLAGPADVKILSTSVTVENLRGTLLPAPPGALRVRAGGQTSVLPDIGVYRPSGMASGMTYRVESALALGGAGRTVRAPAPGQVAPYLSLPPLPADVVSLAHQVAGGIADPRQRALRLVQFFDDGSFRYSLTASNGTSAPLETFLFDTRTGACQQFAGAYAVLARLVGLPTRVAVGFTAGTRAGPGRYTVTTADAHTWPEVYLGPGPGWVSFEPTPSSGPVVTAAGVVYAGTGGHVEAVPGQFDAPGRASIGSTVPGPTAVPAVAVPGGLVAATGEPGPAPWKGVTAWLAGALLVLVAGMLSRRQLRDVVDGVRCSAMGPAGAVVVRWQQAARALGRRRLGRELDETALEHAERLSERLGPAARCYGELARLASRTLYSGLPASPADARDARRLWAGVRRELRSAPGVRPRPRRRRPAMGHGRRGVAT
jgi:transglutaminase-like putative cysteine protease